LRQDFIAMAETAGQAQNLASVAKGLDARFSKFLENLGKLKKV
jgi:hypothetical protein